MLFNKTVAVFATPGVRIGMDVMLSDYRHWLEYDPVALAVLLVGVGFVELIVLSILPRASSLRQLALRLHSITSSSRTRSIGGTSTPSVLAVFKLRTVSYFVDACT